MSDLIITLKFVLSDVVQLLKLIAIVLVPVAALIIVIGLFFLRRAKRAKENQNIR
jgi:membrane protein DedA with SNARE-associated domain